MYSEKEHEEATATTIEMLEHDLRMLDVAVKVSCDEYGIPLKPHWYKVQYLLAKRRSIMETIEFEKEKTSDLFGK